LLPKEAEAKERFAITPKTDEVKTNSVVFLLGSIFSVSV
jgi:hypothetical protein